MDEIILHHAGKGEWWWARHNSDGVAIGASTRTYDSERKIREALEESQSGEYTIQVLDGTAEVSG